MRKDLKYLCVCSGNINRSPALEYILKGAGFEADSCGLGKTAAKNLKMTKRMKEVIGEDVDHTSKQITQELVDWADVIFCMGPGQVKKVNKNFNTDKACLPSCGKVEDPHFTGNYANVFNQLLSSLS